MKSDVEEIDYDEIFADYDLQGGNKPQNYYMENLK